MRTTEALSTIPKHKFTSYVQPSNLTSSMVEIDRGWERITLLKNNNWKDLPKHPDLILKNELTLLHEYLFEAQRLNLLTVEPQYQPSLTQAYTQSLTAIQSFRQILETSKASHSSYENAYQVIKKSCSSCHRKFRN